MKRYDNLFDKIANFENLYHAFEDSQKGKRYKGEVIRISIRAELIVSDLVRELQTGEYRPGSYYEFEARKEVKRRLIHAPLFRDRIVQNGIRQIITPLFEKKFIYDSYANRENKGNHKAVKRVQQFLRQASDGSYVLQGDYRKYYDSIDHDVLKEEMRRTIKDIRLLKVLDDIIDSYNGDTGKGIPIGAPISQLLANVHLNPQDHMIKDGLHVKRYVRLMDDFIIIGTKEEVKEIWKDIKWFADCHLKQPLHPKTRIYPVSHGVDFGGYRIFKNKILPRKRNIKAAKIRFKTISWLFKYGEIDVKKAGESIESFLGYMKHCSETKATTNTLRYAVLSRASPEKHD